MGERKGVRVRDFFDRQIWTAVGWQGRNGMGGCHCPSSGLRMYHMNKNFRAFFTALSLWPVVHQLSQKPNRQSRSSHN